MKLWGGRFKSKTSSLMDDFNSSIRVDARMYAQDIRGSIAHAKMLAKCGIITGPEASLICGTLTEILKDIECGNVELSIEAEDIHMNVETILIERIGDTGKKLHTARSRNDQVALDVRMYLMDEAAAITELLELLCETLLGMSEKNLYTVMPAYTHMQRAQPISLAHYFLAYYEMFQRDIERIGQTKERTNSMPLGAGAVAGTTFPIDREFVAKELNFRQVCLNSMDAVSDRDFVLELAFDLALVIMHLSRFSEEIVLWSSSEFGFITLDDAYSTGSSIMPQKKNPDAAELVRGKSGRVYGNLMALLTMMKGLPLAYNKDMQEDKELIFDSVDTIKLCLPVFIDMLRTMQVNKEKMLKATQEGFLNATDLADYLVKKGESFRNAHEIAGRIVLCCEQEGKSIEDLPLETLKEYSELIQEDVFEAISIQNCVEQRNVLGGTAFRQIKSRLDDLSATQVKK